MYRKTKLIISNPNLGFKDKKNTYRFQYLPKHYLKCLSCNYLLFCAYFCQNVSSLSCCCCWVFATNMWVRSYEHKIVTWPVVWKIVDNLHSASVHNINSLLNQFVDAVVVVLFFICFFFLVKNKFEPWVAPFLAHVSVD